MENFKSLALDAKGTSSKGLANVLCSILCVMCRHVNPTSTLLATQPTIRTATVTLKPITQPVKRQGNREQLVPSKNTGLLVLQEIDYWKASELEWSNQRQEDSTSYKIASFPGPAHLFIVTESWTGPWNKASYKKFPPRKTKYMGDVVHWYMEMLVSLT